MTSTAKSVRRLLDSKNLTRATGEGDWRPSVRFLANDSVERFVRVGNRFLSRPISSDEVELVDL